MYYEPKENNLYVESSLPRGYYNIPLCTYYNHFSIINFKQNYNKVLIIYSTLRLNDNQSKDPGTKVHFEKSPALFVYCSSKFKHIFQVRQ